MVVVEDLISTGGSVIEVVNVLREAGAEVLGVVSIFTYGMKKGLPSPALMTGTRECLPATRGAPSLGWRMAMICPQVRRKNSGHPVL